jgi:hypothetical protein
MPRRRAGPFPDPGGHKRDSSGFSTQTAELFAIKHRPFDVDLADLDPSRRGQRRDDGAFTLHPLGPRRRLALAEQEEIPGPDLTLDQWPELVRLRQRAQMEQQRSGTEILQIVPDLANPDEISAGVRNEDPWWCA